jgi:protein ImuB
LRLSTDRILRQLHGPSWRDGTTATPLAIVARVKGALRLVALDATAERLGLTRGMALADARAMIPALAVADDDSAADAALLAAIADWAERYTPLVSIQEAWSAEGATGNAKQEARTAEGRTGTQKGLFLDITGCAHLFGGESELAADLVARLGRQGFSARAAIAATPGAASALARFGPDSISVVPPGVTADVLKPLLLAALRLPPDTVAALDRVGLKRIGQIVGAPRAPLAARFGRALTQRLDQALGIDDEAISPRRPAPVLLAERRFAEPIGLEEDIAAALASLAATLCQTMEKQGLGARLLELALFRVDGVVSRIAVGTGRPFRDAKRIGALFKERFASLGDALDAGFGFDMVRLAVTEAAPFSAAQIDLTGDAAAENDLDGLIDRIGARLGSHAVGRLAPRDSHIPERAESFDTGDPSPVGGGITRRTVGGEQFDDDTIIRPLRLFARPEPVEAIAEVPDGPPARFRWRRTLYRVARAEGPERIAAEWWRDDDLTRDYFRVEDLTGHRFWLFREGLYGRETTAPRWYLHGVFA